MSAFCFLFSEYIQYSLTRENGICKLENRVSDVGYSIGTKILELITFREKTMKRETTVIGILSFISYTVWKILFGKNADSLEKSTEPNDDCTCNYLFHSTNYDRYDTRKCTDIIYLNTSPFQRITLILTLPVLLLALLREYWMPLNLYFLLHLPFNHV